MSFVMSDAIRMAASLVVFLLLGVSGSDLPVEGFALDAQAAHQIAERDALIDGEARPGRFRFQGVDEAVQAAPASCRRARRGTGVWGQDGREGRPQQVRPGAIPPRSTAGGNEKSRPDVRGKELVDRFSR